MGTLTAIALAYIIFAANAAGTVRWNYNDGLQKLPKYLSTKYELKSPHDGDAISRRNHDDVDIQSSDLKYEYCKLGGHLEHLSLHCKSGKLTALQKDITDADQPPDIQMLAMIVSSIAVGCPKTAVFLSGLLLENRNINDPCNESILNGPEESQSISCNEEVAKSVKSRFGKRMRIQYETLSTSLFLSLGCHNLGQTSGVDLVDDITRNTTYLSEILLSFLQKQRDDSAGNENTAVMSYINKHKNDASNIPKVDETDETSSEASNENSVDNGRMRRNTDNFNNGDYSELKENCKIILPLGETLYLESKTECLQLCIDEDSCHSVGYTNDGSQTCQLNTETEKEVGPFFSCRNDDSKAWDYFEKKRDVNYFIISSKSNGKVLEAISETTVRLVSFTSDDKQYWFWKDDVIISKKYSTKALELNKGRTSQAAEIGHLTLGSYEDVSNQRWNFQDDALISQYDDSRLDMKHSYGVTTLTLNHHSSQEWSLSLDRFYFIILGRQSGKVLDISGEDCSKGTIHLWEYHGRDNQLWFWDDENIRSKECPDKVIDFHVSDYDKNGWGKVHMNYFNGGDNQKWRMEKNSFVSRVRDLRLDVRYQNIANGAAVGCYANNGGFNQQWNINTAINYFFILNKKTGRVMDASSPTAIKQWHYHYGDNQLWFWDSDVIRSKKYTDKVIDLHYNDFKKNGWGKIYLHAFHGGSNQKWEYADKYLLSGFNKLGVEVQGNSYTDGSLIGAKKTQTQEWNLIPAHDVFTMTSRMNAKVVEATSKDSVSMFQYHGKDNQLWFLDGQALRSKKYPEKVLDLHKHDNRKSNWGKVHLFYYHGGSNQRWTLNGDFLISSYKKLNMDIRNSNTKDGAKVFGLKTSGNSNQKWSFNSKERIYFIIKEACGEKVVDVTRDLRIILWSNHGGDNQLWFWDKDSIRSKKYPEKVIDLHMVDYRKTSWGKVYANNFHGGANQRWKVDGHYIISEFQSLHLDVYEGNSRKGAKVGGQKAHGGLNQQWILAPPTGKSCIDKTENAIYNFVQNIPFISTLWELGSSIGYAAAGCTNVAQERAIAMSFGLVMDIITIGTAGAAGPATTAATIGVNAGIKVVIKKGMKKIMTVASSSIRNAYIKWNLDEMENGLQTLVETTIKKSDKLMIRETSVDPTLFLKNAGKVSKRLLFHPKITMKQSWKIASDNIDNLKKIRQKLESLNKTGADDIANTGKFRCGRSPSFLCFINENPKGYSRSQSKMYKALLQDNPQPKTLDKCAKRYMSIQGSFFERKMSSAPNIVQTKMKQLDTELEKAELFAMYEYIETPAVDLYTSSILNGKPILEGESVTKTFIEELEKDIDKFSYQAGLMQDYIKKHTMNLPQTVYRYETFDVTGHLYNNSVIYISTNFMSATKKTSGFRTTSRDLTTKNKYNVKLTINLKKSGSDISGISHNPAQEEILIPVNTKFDVQRLDHVDGITKITLTEII